MIYLLLVLTLTKLLNLQDGVHFYGRVAQQEDQEELSTGLVGFLKQLPGTVSISNYLVSNFNSKIEFNTNKNQNGKEYNIY